MSAWLQGVHGSRIAKKFLKNIFENTFLFLMPRRLLRKKKYFPSQKSHSDTPFFRESLIVRYCVAVCGELTC